MHVPTLCDWFSSPASASDPIPTIWFSLDHKRNVSDGVVSGIGTRFSLDHKVYASYYDSDSDSVASENQPLVAHTKARCVWLVVEGSRGVLTDHRAELNQMLPRWISHLR